MNSITDLTPRQLRQAANIQEKIQDLQKELAVILGGEIPVPFATEPRKGKRRMSAAGRAAISAAAKARWAKIKGTAPKKKRKMSVAWRKALERGWAARRAKGRAAKGKAVKRAKRNFSAAGLAALSAAAKARWAKVKAAGKTKL